MAVTVIEVALIVTLDTEPLARDGRGVARRAARPTAGQSQPRLWFGDGQHRADTPTIAVASIWLTGPLHLGLGANHIVLLALTCIVTVLTVVPGHATLLQAGVHLALLAAYLFLAINP